MGQYVTYVKNKKRVRFLHLKLFISRMVSLFHWHYIRNRNSEKGIYSILNISGRVMKPEKDVAAERQFPAMLYFLLLTCIIQNILIYSIHLTVELTYFLFITQSVASCLTRSLLSLFHMMKLA